MESSLSILDPSVLEGEDGDYQPRNVRQVCVLSSVIYHSSFNRGRCVEI